MNAQVRQQNWWLETAVIVAAWTVFSLIQAHQFHVQSELLGRPGEWTVVLVGALMDSYLWALSTIVIFWLARRVPLERRRLLLALIAHFGAAVLLGLARTAIRIELNKHVLGLNRRPFSMVFWGSYSVTILYYALLLGIAHAVLYHGRYREGQRTAERLAAGLTEARLQALKMQLQPHFLFNTLNAISALIPAQAQAARQMVAHLGDLLRISLENEDLQEVTLLEELASLEPYLEIEKARLQERLTVEMRIDPETLEARVPHLLLQPVVENAIRHGVAPRIEPGRVEITASVRDRRQLHLTVRDDGAGLERSEQSRTRKAVGLANVRARLEELYGPAQSLTLENHPEGGVVVRISLPLRSLRDADVPPAESGQR